MNESGSIRRAASGILARVPASLLHTLAGGDPLVPYYHMVSDVEIPHVRHLYRYKSVGEFNADLEFLLRRYKPVAISDLLDHVTGRHDLPERAFLLTFDDGFREMHDIVAPILSAKGVSATFFLNSAFVDNRELCYLNKASLLVDQYLRHSTAAITQELMRLLASSGIYSRDVPSGIRAIGYKERAVADELARVLELDYEAYLSSVRPYLTASQVRSLIASGFSIGAHSIDHPLYASIALEEQLRQTIASVRAIRQAFQLSYGAFAFPHSDRSVSKEFFDRLSSAGVVDVSFGTAGLLRDTISTHIQRFSLEAPVEPARRILAFQHIRRVVKKMAGSGTVMRQ
jgi:peptidoglycan/xylan/chitin deacetylase (PgdA/CDA1 family)